MWIMDDLTRKQVAEYIKNKYGHSIKPGDVFEHEDELYTILEIHHGRRGEDGSIFWLEVRNLETKKVSQLHIPEPYPLTPQDVVKWRLKNRQDAHIAEK